MRTPPESTPLAMWAYEELQAKDNQIKLLEEQLEELKVLVQKMLANSST